MQPTKRWKQTLSVLILLVSAFVTYRYIRTHPEVLTSLRHTSLVLVGVLLALFSLTIVALVIILEASLKIAGGQVSKKQKTLLVVYSSLINFFGPLQSGPGFRALYLKKYHSISLKRYSYATLVYYFLYSVISAVCVVLATSLWWLAIPMSLLLFAVIIGSSRYELSRKIKFAVLESASLMVIGVVIQVVTLWLLYYFELRSIDPTIGLRQILGYTGIANLTLFVAFTPGGIGFRESFLVLSQKIHNIDPQTIIAANIIDRSVYILFLGIIGILALYFKATQQLHVKQLSRKPRQVND